MISELLVIFLVSVLLLFGLKSRRKVPPGPPQVPILGSIPFLTLEKGVGDYFLDECITRNKISTVAVGPVYKPFIINDFDLAKVYIDKPKAKVQSKSQIPGLGLLLNLFLKLDHYWGTF